MKGLNRNETLTMTVEEVRLALGIGRNSAYELMHSPDFPSFCIGKKLLVSRSKFEEWLSHADETCNKNQLTSMPEQYGQRLYRA